MWEGGCVSSRNLGDSVPPCWAAIIEFMTRSDSHDPVHTWRVLSRQDSKDRGQKQAENSIGEGEGDERERKNI